MLAVFCPADHVVKHSFFISCAHQDEIVSTDCPNCAFTAAKTGPRKVTNPSNTKGQLLAPLKRPKPFQANRFLPPVRAFLAGK